MSSFTNEFKVGLLTILAGILMTLLVLQIDDRPDGAIDGYELIAYFPSAEGLYPSTQVVMAGVSVGSVREIELDVIDRSALGEEAGESTNPKVTRARVLLEMSGDLMLPTDSTAELRASGILGDKIIRITPGDSMELLGQGDSIEVRTSGPDMDALTEQGEQIAADVQAITSSLRELIEDPAVKEGFLATVENVKALSEDIRSIEESNQDEISQILSNLEDITTSLNTLISETSEGLEGDMDDVRETLAKLDRTMASVESIAAKVDQGEGTLGALINDDAPATSIQSTLDEVNTSMQEIGDLVGTIANLQTELEYRGQYFIGSDPSDTRFDGNPVAGASKNTLAISLKPQEDYWYRFEVVDHPLGSIDYEETYNPELGTFYAEYTRNRDLRFSFQFARRLQNTVLRLGLKESSGGVGIDQYLLKDRIRLTADLYDFTNGSWPIHDGTPNLALGLRAEPIRHLYLEAGLENALLGYQFDYYTAWFGGGFHFTDNDVKWLLSTVPAPQ